MELKVWSDKRKTPEVFIRTSNHLLLKRRKINHSGEIMIIKEVESANLLKAIQKDFNNNLAKILMELRKLINLLENTLGLIVEVRIKRLHNHKQQVLGSLEQVQEQFTSRQTSYLVNLEIITEKEK